MYVCILVDTKRRQNWLHNFARFLVEPWLLPGCALWGHWWPRIALPWQPRRKWQRFGVLCSTEKNKISHLVHLWYVQLQGFKLRMWRMWKSTNALWSLGIVVICWAKAENCLTSPCLPPKKVFAMLSVVDVHINLIWLVLPFCIHIRSCSSSRGFICDSIQKYVTCLLHHTQLYKSCTSFWGWRLWDALCLILLRNYLGYWKSIEII